MQTTNKRLGLYIGLYLFAMAYRLFLHYQTDLIPGINGGYYLVQLRAILETGQLGFEDMPLYFYLSAGIVHLISLFSSASIESISVHVVKGLDSFILPLLLIPLYFIVQELQTRKVSVWQEVSLILWAVLSVSPLLFLGDFQKNGFAIPFIFLFLLGGIRYLKYQDIKSLLGLGTSLLLIGLSHFGAFSFTLILAGMGLIIYKGKRAIIPIIALGSFALWGIALFDTTRAWRLLSSITEVVSYPALLRAHPPEWIVYITTYIFLWLSYKPLFKDNGGLAPWEKYLLKTCWITMAFLSFPFLNGEYAGRLILMLFIPQGIILYYIFYWYPLRIQKRISWSIAILTLAVLVMMVPFKQPTLGTESYQELSTLNTSLPDKEESIIITRHGLEWWVNWNLEVKVGNERALDTLLFNQYATVYILEIKQQRFRGPGLRQKNLKPQQGSLSEQFSGEHFKLYQWHLQ